MSTLCVSIEEQVEIPWTIRSLADFRAWALSDDFPEQGRIDYIDGRIEVDMSPEDVICHGTLKGEIHRVLANRVKAAGSGFLVTDSTRVSSPQGVVSSEPDVVYISEESRQSGRVRLVPKASGEAGRYVEVEGAPDLIVEVVSDSSVTKDTKRLPEGYARAGVPEFWLADARGESLVFQVHRLVESRYEPAETDADGYQRSAVFGCSFRLDGARDERGDWRFDLREKEG